MILRNFAVRSKSSVSSFGDASAGSLLGFLELSFRLPRFDP